MNGTIFFSLPFNTPPSPPVAGSPGHLLPTRLRARIRPGQPLQVCMRRLVSTVHVRVTTAGGRGRYPPSLPGSQPSRVRSRAHREGGRAAARRALPLHHQLAAGRTRISMRAHTRDDGEQEITGGGAGSRVLWPPQACGWVCSADTWDLYLASRRTLMGLVRDLSISSHPIGSGHASAPQRG